jgi:hypothetical protein
VWGLGAWWGAGLLDNVCADYLWARAVLLVGPTIASAGMTIQVCVRERERKREKES